MLSISGMPACGISTMFSGLPAPARVRVVAACLLVCALSLDGAPALARTATRLPNGHSSGHKSTHAALPRSCFSAGAVIATHGRKLTTMGEHTKLFAPVGTAMYYAEKRHGCLLRHQKRRRG